VALGAFNGIGAAHIFYAEFGGQRDKRLIVKVMGE